MSDKRRTPESWDGPEDARTLPGAGKYPNYYSHKTRSGHVIMMDDSDGAEHVTIQHRGGTMIQIGPTGTLNITSHDGQYNIVFGENRMLVTGAHDISVQGDASLRVDGDYDVHVNGNISFNAQGDLNMSAKNVNTVARGNIDTQGKNRSEKIEGSIRQEAQGGQTIQAATGMTIGVTSGNLAIFSLGLMSIVSKTGNLLMKAAGVLGLKSTSTVGIESTVVTVRASTALLLQGAPISLFAAPLLAPGAIPKPIPAPGTLDAVTTFTHIPAPPAIPDSQGALDLDYLQTSSDNIDTGTTST